MEMKFCAACSMPLESNELIGLETEIDVFCIHCVDEYKAVRPCADIFNGGVQFFMQHVGLDRALAERVTRKHEHAALLAGTSTTSAWTARLPAKRNSRTFWRNSSPDPSGRAPSPNSLHPSTVPGNLSGPYPISPNSSSIKPRNFRATGVERSFPAPNFRPSTGWRSRPALQPWRTLSSCFEILS